jgi:hypothetical protein
VPVEPAVEFPHREEERLLNAFLRAARATPVREPHAMMPKRPASKGISPVFTRRLVHPLLGE